MDATKSALWHNWQSVIRDAGKLAHNASQAYELLPRDMYLEMLEAANIAHAVAVNCQKASLTEIDILDLLACDLEAADAWNTQQSALF